MQVYEKIMSDLSKCPCVCSTIAFLFLYSLFKWLVFYLFQIRVFFGDTLFEGDVVIYLFIILLKLSKKYKNYIFLIITLIFPDPGTTRQPRDGEISGVDYNFVSIEEFFSLEESGALLESGKFKGQN